MNISGINQIYNEKLQDIKSRVPDTNIDNKFKSCLENAKLKVNPAEEKNIEEPASEGKSSSVDTNTLLSSLLTSSLNSSTSSLLSSTSSQENSIFPTSSMNNSLQMLQQTALLKSLNLKSEK